MMLVVVLYALLALIFPLAQMAVYAAHPLVVIGVRMVLAGCLLLLYSFMTKRWCPIAREDRGLFFQVALFHIYIAFVPEFWALQYISAFKTTILYASSPFITAVLEYFLYKVRFTSRQLLGLICGFIGMGVIIANPDVPCSHVLHVCTYPYLPEIALMGAIISAAYAWFLIKKLMNKGYHLLAINGAAMLGGGTLSFLTLPLAHVALFSSVYDWWTFLWTLLALIFISNVVFYNLYAHLLSVYSLTFLSLAGFLSPLFGALYAWLLFGQDMSISYALAGVFIASGLWFFNTSPSFSFKNLSIRK